MKAKTHLFIFLLIPSFLFLFFSCNNSESINNEVSEQQDNNKIPPNKQVVRGSFSESELSGKSLLEKSPHPQGCKDIRFYSTQECTDYKSIPDLCNKELNDLKIKVCLTVTRKTCCKLSENSTPELLDCNYKPSYQISHSKSIGFLDVIDVHATPLGNSNTEFSIDARLKRTIDSQIEICDLPTMSIVLPGGNPCMIQESDCN